MPFSTLICCNTATWQGQFCWDDIPSWNLIFDKAALSCDFVCVHIYAHTHTYKQPPWLALWWIISLFFFHCTLHDFANEHVSLLSLYAFAKVVSEWCYTLITQVETSQACGTAALWVPLKMRVCYCRHGPFVCSALGPFGHFPHHKNLLFPLPVWNHADCWMCSQ